MLYIAYLDVSGLLLEWELEWRLRINSQLLEVLLGGWMRFVKLLEWLVTLLIRSYCLVNDPLRSLCLNRWFFVSNGRLGLLCILLLIELKHFMLIPILAAGVGTETLLQVVHPIHLFCQVWRWFEWVIV